MIELTQGGLFEGIGGFPLAAIWAGIKPIWSNEIDPWCCKVLRKNFNHEIIEKDIRQISTDTTNARFKGVRERENETNDKKGNIKLRPVDILTGGFPCQPFSHAGKRKGKDDNRYLWPEYLRLIRELQPSWIIAENVAGLISMENGRTLEGILDDLENENYQTEIYNIPACGVGAWHKRERIWIVCHPTKSGLSDGRSSQMGQSGEVKKFKRSGSKYDSNTIKLNDDITGYGSGSVCGIGQTQAEIQRRQYDNGIWQFEPAVGRVANGISGRVDRLKGLGNAIVPQVAYEIFKAIVEYENQTFIK